MVIKSGVGGPIINPSAGPEPPGWGGDGGCGPFFYIIVLGLIGWGIWAAVSYFFPAASQ